jgi:Flp pilus assembly protein CpaB
MDYEYKDNSRKGRYVIIAGVLLAVVTGGIAFFTVNQAQQQAGQTGLKTVPVVVAVATIQAREPIKAESLVVRNVPLDASNAAGVVSDPGALVGRLPAVTILAGQIVTTNMLASSEGGAEFSILGPDETIGPDSEALRAISITVSDDLAVGGTLKVGQTVDVFVTTVVDVQSKGAAPVAVTPAPTAAASPGDGELALAAATSAPASQPPTYISERSTKITYQDIVILARNESFYIIRAPVAIAEEIAHLQATGAATFSFALRPAEDQRMVDATNLGETTNRIIAKYGLPVPEGLVPGYTPAPTPVVTPPPSPAPSAEPSTNP